MPRRAKGESARNWAGARRLGAIAVFFSITVAALASIGCAKEVTDVEHLKHAQEFQAKNQWRAALIEYKNALQKNPQNVDARFLLGKFYLEIGNGAAAEKELRRASEAESLREQTTAPIAQSLLLQKRYDDLLQEFSALSEKNANAELSGLVAEAYANKEVFDKAKDAIARAIELDSAAVPVMLSAARVALARNNSSEASEWVDKAIARAPTSASAWLLKADLAYVAANHHDAEMAYQKELELDDRQILTQRSIRARVGLVFTLLAQDKEQEALPHIDALLKANSKHFLSNYLRGLAAFKKADYSTALDYLQRSTQSAPVSSPAYAMLGAVNYAMKNYQQSELFLGKYVAVVPDDMVARKLLGVVRLKLDQPEKALEALGGVEGGSDSDDTQLLTLMGEAAARSGDYREGREYFRKAMKSADHTGALQTQVAQTYLAEGEYDRAIAQLQQAAQQSETPKQAKILEVMAYLKKNDYATALQKAQMLVADQPRDPEMQNILGGVYLAQKNVREARIYFEKALAIQANFVPALLNLASLDLHEKKYVDARSQFLKVLETESGNTIAMISLSRIEEAEDRQAAAVEWLEKARAANRFALEPRLLLARYFLRRGDFDKAETAAQEALDAHASSAAALTVLGDIQLARKQYDRAASTYDALVKAHPKDGFAYLRLGQARASLNQVDQSRKAFKQALAIDAGIFPAVAALCALESRAGNFSAATQIVEDYIAGHAKNADGYTLRGDVAMAQAQFGVADKAYARAFSIQQTNILVVKRFRAMSRAASGGADIELLKDWLEKHPNDDLVQLTLADAYQKKGRSAEAVDVYNAMLADNPNQVVALNNLALAYLSYRDPRAKSVAEKAYSLAGANPAVIDTLGWVLLEMGETGRAKDLLADAAAKLPMYPDIQTHYAIALEKTGEVERAREILRRVLKDPRSFELRARAEQLLARLN